ncbi:phage tail tape measure protein [Acinetobacter bouvetii]|uniref:Phage-related minor tail protein n=1 Tax=Acinetobacter bouvetii TaxID=202951 RepID=A0A811GFK2_9GAMM|nr:phage tail tape measure protein [Acinetobacter bouvetii]CAB1222475.1 Phage-related minor tail protein [Acinetobacter bouvetii]
MSGKNTTVSLTLQIKGNAGQEMKKISDQQIQATTKINQQWTQIGSANAKFVQTAKAGTQATVNTARAGENLLRTNRMLEGVLRQQSIQTKLQSQQLKQQQSSAQQMANWMKQVAQSSRQTKQEAQQTVSLWQKGVALGGAAVAGGAVVSSALQKPRDYAQQMTYITATATGGQGLTAEQRLAKTSTFEGFVKNAVRNGGGKREDVAAALNELIASGKYDESNVSSALLSSSKTAFAAGADTVDAAKMTIAMQNFGVKNLDLAQDRSMRAGQVGSFEYKDLAKFLPGQMAMAKSFGYSGDEGLVKLLALNQTAKSTAADSSEAGNNVVNLLQKLSSRELADTLADKVSNTDGLPTKAVKNKKGQVVSQEFDWATYSTQQREQGVYGVEAFVKLLERQLQGNAQYTKLQKEANAAKTDEERKAKLEDMSNIAMGSELGQFLADRQALLAAMAAVYNKDKTVALEKEIGNAAGTVDSDLSMIKQTEWAKDQAADQEGLFAQSKAYDSVSETLGKVKENITDWAQKHEELAANAYKASVALAAVAAAGAVGTVLGGGKGGAGKMLGGAATAARAGGSLLATGAMSTAGQVAIAGVAGYGIGTGIRGAYMTTEAGQSFDDKLGESITKTLAFFGNDNAKAALESQAKYDAMIAQQEQSNKLASDLSGKLSTLISVTQNNKPVINLSGSPLMQSMSSTSSNEEKRHGAPPAYLMRK